MPPIPDFDPLTNALPPHLGDPRQPQDLSPYPATALELCKRFATSPARIEILHGWLRLRRELQTLGFAGFQWIDGSFVEDVEAAQNREPRDIDVVSFLEGRSDELKSRFDAAGRRALLSPVHCKQAYRVDHYLVPLDQSGVRLVEFTRYWYGLFSHTRNDAWKGMVRVPLGSLADDDQAEQWLGGQ